MVVASCMPYLSTYKVLQFLMFCYECIYLNVLLSVRIVLLKITFCLSSLTTL